MAVRVEAVGSAAVMVSPSPYQPTLAPAKAVVEEWKEQHQTETPEQVEARRYTKRSLRFADPADGMITATLTLPTLAAREVQAAVSHIAGKPSERDGRTTGQRLADGLVQLCAAYAKGAVSGGRERPTLLITAPAETLTQHADTQTAITDTTGNVVALTTTQRLATDHQWRALVARDGGCRHPDCHIPAHWCDIDHLTPWEHGGPTTLDNLALWCRHHHTVKHQPGVEVSGSALNLQLRLPDGTTVPCPPRPLHQRHTKPPQRAPDATPPTASSGHGRR
ncbi:MAG: HNH endonuclease [Actinomycetota bacterium]